MAGNTIYVQGNYVDVHDNEVVNVSIDKVGSMNVSKKRTEHGQAELPEVLATSELWERLKQARLIDDDNQPTVSRPEAALMVNMLASRLNITNKWKMFEALWHCNNLRNDYNTALEQKKSLEFQDRLKNIFG